MLGYQWGTRRATNTVMPDVVLRPEPLTRERAWRWRWSGTEITPDDPNGEAEERYQVSYVHCPICTKFLRTSYQNWTTMACQFCPTNMSLNKPCANLGVSPCCGYKMTSVWCKFHHVVLSNISSTWLRIVHLMCFPSTNLARLPRYGVYASSWTHSQTVIHSPP